MQKMKVEVIAFKTEYAEEYGIECAILIQGIQFGLALNKYKETHNHFGKVWMYNSVAEWQRTYPFMSESTIKRCLTKLKELGIIEVMQLDSNPMNKTNWYTLTNALGQFEPMEEVTLNQSKQYKPNNVKQTIFIKPSIEVIKSEFPEIDAYHFYDFYESKGWKVGSTKMKDWKATARNWIRNQNKFKKEETKGTRPPLATLD